MTPEQRVKNASKNLRAQQKTLGDNVDEFLDREPENLASRLAGPLERLRRIAARRY
jgi:hypothetical protein